MSEEEKKNPVGESPGSRKESEEAVESIREKAVKAEEKAAPEKEKKAEEKKPEAEKKPETKKDELAEKEKEIEALKKENADLNEQVAKLKNAYAMAYADTENTRKRLTKEFDQHMKYHIQDFAVEILPVMDNCERALAVKPKDGEDENYRKAFEMVYKHLDGALKKEGVEEIKCEGKDYDPNWMQAMMTEKVEGVEPGKVTAVLQKGYKLKDRLLRAAMVKVSE